ncbi:ATP-grasp domain-containing protein [Pseudomonas citronellolis]|uniref:ATP-grasp domain-containing protein n=1 Tax=Pseudomonas citronellolis TaxID=53408 RepID=UPI0021112388|nr:ATP-grasp domain-containing protein [Pseudomonas citronellolis]UUC51908.1 ATP-grasp domain-containing protein [Pseudomonas citronellolis]
MSKVRVLVFPCGTEVGLEIARALEHSLHVELHGASSRVDHGEQAYVRHAHLPNIADATFDECFAHLLAQWNIDLVFATHDSVQDYLAPRVEGLGVQLVNGDARTARIARRKSLTYELLDDTPWVPRRYANAAAVEAWPVVVKPDQGQGGQGVTLVADADELAVAQAVVQQPLVCEYLPGEELTVDCFTSHRGQLLHVGARSRERVVGGIAMRSGPRPTDTQLNDIATTLNARLALRGPWFFQVRRDRQGDWKLLEFSSRLSTGSVVARALGVNLPLLAVQDYLGRDLLLLPEPRLQLVERRLENKAVLDYDFDTCYLDLDDTLVCAGRANPQAMRLAYRLLQLDKRLVLLTRHAGDLTATLEAAHIPLTMFERIVHLREGEPKSDHVRAPAIFIDNHFPERLDVSRRHDIPVFDVDAMDLLF